MKIVQFLIKILMIFVLVEITKRFIIDKETVFIMGGLTMILLDIFDEYVSKKTDKLNVGIDDLEDNIKLVAQQAVRVLDGLVEEYEYVIPSLDIELGINGRVWKITMVDEQVSEEENE